MPAFLALYADCDSGLKCLYEEAGKIATLDPEARQARLDTLKVRQESARDD